jgi:hypothetical protein
VRIPGRIKDSRNGRRRDVLHYKAAVVILEPFAPSVVASLLIVVVIQIHHTPPNVSECPTRTQPFCNWRPFVSPGHSIFRGLLRSAIQDRVSPSSFAIAVIIQPRPPCSDNPRRSARKTWPSRHTSLCGPLFFSKCSIRPLPSIWASFLRSVMIPPPPHDRKGNRRLKADSTTSFSFGSAVRKFVIYLYPPSRLPDVIVQLLLMSS